MGFTEASGKAGCRWVAVRHGPSMAGNNHIHVAVSLVREDGTKASIHHDHSRAQSIARELEQEHGLQLLESCGSDMAMRGERPGEREIANRRGHDTVASVRLERGVRAAAAAALDEGEFVRRLHQAGVLVRPRFAADRDDVVAGYSVALRPGNRDETIVWDGGGRLARDLTLQRLRDGWPDTPSRRRPASTSGEVLEVSADLADAEEAQELRELGELGDAGILTPEEFEAEKVLILG